MISYLFPFLFICIPTGVFIFFIISLCRFLSARNANKLTPDAFAPEQMRERKILLIVSGVIAAIMAAVIIGFSVLLAMAIAYM